jgi:hypothetical protein
MNLVISIGSKNDFHFNIVSSIVFHSRLSRPAFETNKVIQLLLKSSSTSSILLISPRKGPLCGSSASGAFLFNLR